jgi:hypothetical protein
MLKQKSKDLPSCPRTGCHENSYEEPLLQLVEGLVADEGPASWEKDENGGSSAGCGEEGAVIVTTAQ